MQINLAHRLLNKYDLNQNVLLKMYESKGFIRLTYNIFLYISRSIQLKLEPASAIPTSNGWTKKYKMTI